MSPRIRAAVSAVVVLPMIASLAVAQTPAAYKKDQKVEVREGDVWSAATVMEQEGRRVHVKYDDGSDEWVPLTRVRAPGTTGTSGSKGTPPAGTTGTDKSDAKPAEPPKEILPSSGKCEVKSGTAWKPATIKNRDGNLFLVMYDGWEHQMHWDWVPGECVRAVGSDKEGPRRGESQSVGGRGVQASKAEAKRLMPKWQQAFRAEQAKRNAKNNPAGGDDEGSGFDKPVVVAKTDGITIQQARQDGTNAYTPDAATGTAAGPISLAKGDWNRDAEVLANGRFAVASTSQGNKLYNVQVIDLASGNATASLEFDALSRPFGVSNNGKTVIGRSDEFFGGTKHRLDFYDVTPGALKHRVSFSPYADARDKNDRDVSFAAMIDGVVVTSNADGDLAGWTLSSGTEPAGVTCKWKTAVGGKAVALSPNGKTIAASRADGLYLIDTATGTTQAFVAATRAADSLAFTPNGKWVVGLSGPTLMIWDVATGRAGPDVGLPPGVAGRSVVGVGPKEALIDSTYLFDVERHAVIWKYDDAADAFSACGRTWAKVKSGDRSLLTPARLPDSAAARAAVAAAEPLFKAGDAVSLDIAVEGDAAKQTALREHFTKELARIGLTVADGRPVRLVVRTENGKSVTKAFSRSMSPFARDGTEVSVTDKISRVTIEADGKPAWETSYTANVGMVSMKEGQSITEAVQQANVFNLDFFQRVMLPSVVSKPREPLVAGSTKWTALGGK